MGGNITNLLNLTLPYIQWMVILLLNLTLPYIQWVVILLINLTLTIYTMGGNITNFA